MELSPILPLIFKQMNLLALLKCKLVNRDFRKLSEQIELNEVIVCDEIQKSKDHWFHTNDQIDFSRSIGIGLFQLSLSKSFFKLNQNLKRLYLSVDYDRRFNFEFLNNFIQLEQLGIEFCSEKNLTRDQVINLSNLKILQLHKEFSTIITSQNQHKIKLTAPELFALSCSNDSLEYLELAETKTVKHLQTDRYLNVIESYKCLESFQCNDIPCTDRWENRFKNILNISDSLKRLNLNFRYAGGEMCGHILRILNHVRQQKIDLNKKELQIYLNGVNFIDEVQLMQTDLDYLGFQFRNYHLLTGDLSFAQRLIYERFLQLTIENIPDDFFKKFYKIHTLIVMVKIIDLDKLILVIKNLNNLTQLHLVNSFIIEQTFFDQLPAICQLTRLEITDNTSINFDFILNFKLLGVLRTNQQLPADLIFKSIEILKNLHLFDFRYNDHRVRLRRTIGNMYEIDLYNILKPGEQIFKEKTGNDLDAIDLNDLLIKLKEAFKQLGEVSFV